ncbi:hypothetical protein N9A94_08390 [Akkermansiaceae bacterium]|nr:hypothetical protein [Akkermansiaceae bacterium]MDB4537863.1 hypothetical protein [Akkermansiaceae bacterium]
MKHTPTLTLGFLLILTTASPGELLILEQFDYEGVDAPLNGANGGMGFESAWEVVGWSRNYETGRTVFSAGDSSAIVDALGGLTFEGHPSAGSALSRFGTAGQREAHRTLTAETQAALTGDDTTIWFSVLACAPSAHKYGTLIFGTDPMIAVQGGSENGNLSSASGQAFGVGFRIDSGGLPGSGSGSPNAVAFIDSSSATVATGSYLPPIEAGASHHNVSLIVGKINWKPAETEDELFLFNISPDGQGEPAEEDAIATLTADFDQSNFNLLSLQDTGSTIYDEIRFGTTFADVSPGVTALLPPAISEITFDQISREVTLTWSSIPDTNYIVKFSPDLIDWTGDLDDAVIGDAGETTTRTFDLTTFTVGSASRLFFRVEKE